MGLKPWFFTAGLHESFPRCTRNEESKAIDFPILFLQQDLPEKYAEVIYSLSAPLRTPSLTQRKAYSASIPELTMAPTFGVENALGSLVKGMKGMHPRTGKHPW